MPESIAGGIRTPWYRPSAHEIAHSQLTGFMRHFGETTGASFASYGEFDRMAAGDERRFWSLFLDWTALPYSGQARRVRVGRNCESASFFPDLRLNYAQCVLFGSVASEDEVAVTSIQGDGGRKTLTRAELIRQVTAFASGLRNQGIGEGDRVVAVLRNDGESIVAALAVAALGASLANAAPEMGVEAIVARFRALEPKALLAHVRARPHDTGLALSDRVSQVADALPTLVVVVALDDEVESLPSHLGAVRSSDLCKAWDESQTFEWRHFPFNQPLFLLASSGTTGPPKCIVHGAGGTLLEHVKEHRLHCDLRACERLFYQTSCAWMMWQWQLSALASCQGIVLYDGPVLGAHTLWHIAGAERVAVFGTSPAYLKLTQDAGLVPSREFDLRSLRAVLSTGSILYDAQYHWFKEAVGELPLHSISGGTDIIGCFVLGNPNLPIHVGESSCRSLGLDVRAASIADGMSDRPEIGELICANPFPSRPLGLFDDADGRRFHASYFERNPGAWSHGDLIEFSADGGARIHGRLDGVLNVRGIRIGPAEVYGVLREFSEVRDALVVEQRNAQSLPTGRAVLFLVMAAGIALDAPLISRIRKRLARALSSAHVPELILPIAELPSTHSGKASEAALRAAVNGLPIQNAAALRNPDSLASIARIAELHSRADERHVAADTPDNIGRVVREAWERSFGFAPIDPEDDYFEIGGHSLQAVELVLTISGVLGREIPTSVLVEAPTIRSMTRLLQGTFLPGPEGLVRLSAGQGRPLFVVHSMAGTLLEMHSVLHALPPARPIYGLQARGFADGEEPHLYVSDMAQEYVARVRQVQPHGPYSIFGYSFGGLVAYEMACQLQRAGEQMETVLLIDPGIDARFLPPRQRLARIQRIMRWRFRLFRDLTARRKLSYLASKGLVLTDRCRALAGLRPKYPHLAGDIVTEADYPPAVRRARGAMQVARRNYRLPRFAGKVVFVHPELAQEFDAMPVWRSAVRGELVLESSPGNHATIILGENAAQLAQVLARHFCI